MSTTDLIRYDLLTQEALRGVMRKVLTDVTRYGLPGEHHFFITFDTRATGVRLSTRLREQYPEDMTIVIQHQYRDLGVTEHAFEIGLSFGGIPERLLIPFAAVSKFVDPSVSFGLQFELLTDSNATELDSIVDNQHDVTEIKPNKTATESVKPPLSFAEKGETDKNAQVVRLDQFRKK